MKSFNVAVLFFGLATALFSRTASAATAQSFLRANNRGLAETDTTPTNASMFTDLLAAIDDKFGDSNCQTFHYQEQKQVTITCSSDGNTAKFVVDYDGDDYTDPSNVTMEACVDFDEDGTQSCFTKDSLAEVYAMLDTSGSSGRLLDDCSCNCVNGTCGCGWDCWVMCLVCPDMRRALADTNTIP